MQPICRIRTSKKRALAALRRASKRYRRPTTTPMQKWTAVIILSVIIGSKFLVPAGGTAAPTKDLEEDREGSGAGWTTLVPASVHVPTLAEALQAGLLNDLALEAPKEVLHFSLRPGTPQAPPKPRPRLHIGYRELDFVYEGNDEADPDSGTERNGRERAEDQRQLLQSLLKIIENAISGPGRTKTISEPHVKGTQMGQARMVPVMWDDLDTDAEDEADDDGSYEAGAAEEARTEARKPNPNDDFFLSMETGSGQGDAPPKVTGGSKA